MEERLVNLEIRYTHLERQLEDLNGVVVEQQKLIDKLVKQLGELKALVAEAGEEHVNERPPHY